MKKFLALIGLAVLASGCVATVNRRYVEVTKDGNGKVISTKYIEEQQQQDSQFPLKFQYLTEDGVNLP